MTATNSAGNASQTSAATGIVTAPTGVLLFNGTFDSPVAAGIPSPWTGGPQCANYGASLTTGHYPGDFYFDNGTSSPDLSPGSLFNAASSATVPPGLGTDSARIVLPVTPAGHTLTYCVIHGLVTTTSDVGTTNYYGLMYYLPPTMTINSSAFQGMNMWEFHQNTPTPVWGSPIALQLHTGGLSNTNGTGNSVVIALETGACNAAGTTKPGCQYRSNAGASTCTPYTDPSIGLDHCLAGIFAQPPGSVQYGTWNELVVQVDEESAATGSIHTWYK
ncbi:MAG TPA: heparin lyase I family protein, partial [Acidimicrobiales bacterium]|nr:heparin lyase I family protein [Acidimicrobiales bacterium]